MERNTLTSFENLCRIFEMRIKLDKEKGIKTPLDIFDNYEKYAKKIDSVYNSEFQKELKPLITPAVTLEKEKSRLKRLIKLLEERLNKRIELEDRFYSATGRDLSGLQVIVSEDELEEKRERLSVISRYLDTEEEINSVDESIVKLRDLLASEEQKEEEYESKNKIMEDELYSSFVSIIKDDDYYRNINEEDIGSELDSIRGSVVETKETLDITKESIGSLATNGLDDDYTSYIEEAERNYFGYKNKELILKIYKLVINFEDDFKLICSKREKINELLEEKRELIESLSIEVEDELVSFEKVLVLQCDTLNNEKEVLDNIANYSSRIKFKEERLEELKTLNNSVDVLAILKEYGLIETYDTDDVVLSEEKGTGDTSKPTEIEIPSLGDDSTDEVTVEEVYNPYRIVEIADYPKTLNVGLAKLKGESVREKVNKKLNPDQVEIMNLENNTGVEEKVDNSTVASKNILEGVDNTISASEMPVWELPTATPEPQTTATPEQNLSSLPIWNMPKPEINPSNTNKIDDLDKLDIDDKPTEVNNVFWMPVSEEKVETREIPSFSVPINNDTYKNSEFSFPTINN